MCVPSAQPQTLWNIFYFNALRWPISGNKLWLGSTRKPILSSMFPYMFSYLVFRTLSRRQKSSTSYCCSLSSSYTVRNYFIMVPWILHIYYVTSGPGYKWKDTSQKSKRNSITSINGKPS